ncbi:MULTISPECIES: riboflavin synthase subunit alpha [unclassified Gilliamella]|uniref:riboflavin synthase subunit alpha n=1 Tax=unclassified Gilliamella TaxID=2685620 RepID=UPI001C69F3F8|nr:MULTISPECIES: riboflavin synthase subunit alpha [unclassified Gilliamella]MCX8602288.1 riboflavin synthase subunit alpha [Gilliamella sp. B3722]MCX8608465.1 riboflavin synthase subunit alpha [Gilliamella sp. B3771]MCX8611550.1 riboflavin synthase subunit alpha [Gilliamella sp. B3891]MCX8614017.1 riboflavin synthase subunit alpha [Gilliamella sp. B3773]MCX8616441.1 riboflavin synthase subunit alpha [Gilliamella sp. B3770]
MFTGIVQGVGQIIDIVDRDKLRTYKVKLPKSLTAKIEIGASIANDGCCLTVTKFENDTVWFDIMQETLALTTLGSKQINDYVNIERSAKFGDEVGGHIMSGHISCTATIERIEKTPTNCTMHLTLPEQFMKYVLYKGFIGIDGASLTIGEVTQNGFDIHLIPETLAITTLGNKQVDDKVNIEIDSQTQAIVDTVERVLATKK